MARKGRSKSKQKRGSQNEQNCYISYEEILYTKMNTDIEKPGFRSLDQNQNTRVR